MASLRGITRADIEARIAEGERIRGIKERFVATSLQRPEMFADRIGEGLSVRFNTLSLPGWLRLAEMSGVPHIPARPLGEAPIASFIDLMDNRPTDFPEMARSVVGGA